MKIEITSLRSEAEKIDDPVQRQEALQDLSTLENTELNLQRRLEVIEREVWEKHYAYKPLSKFRLTLFAILGLSASFFGIGFLLDIMESGILRLPKSQHIIMLDTSPIAYWLFLCIYTLGEVMIIFASLFSVLALLKYPHPPFKWMSRKRTSC